jgi:hypothetical protein
VELTRRIEVQTARRAASTCQCGLSTEPPAGVEWWRPDLDSDPGPSVRAVVRYGEEPELRRAVRLSNGTGWAEHGAMVNFYQDITPPMHWARVGRCWADTPHPVVAVRQEPTGAWTVDF